MTVEVRPATAADEDRVFELLTQLINQEIAQSEEARQVYRELLTWERGCALVVTEGDDVLGVITASFNPAVRYGGMYAQIEELVVDERARGKKGGAALVRGLVDASREHGCREIGLYPREETRAFYERLGFAYVGVELRMQLADHPGARRD